MNEKGLGKQLQAARQAAGLTQQQLCQKANLSFSTLTKIERGAIKSPSIFTVQAIAEAIGTSLDTLLGLNPPIRIARDLKTTRSGVRFIYFDVNGCLVQFFHRAFMKIAEDTGVPSDVIETSFWHLNDEICRGTITMDEFNDRFAKRLKIEKIDWAKYYLETIEVITEMQDLLKWASEHYRVGLLTNIMPGLLRAMFQQGVLPNLGYDCVVDSSEVGTIKPEARIYEIAQAQADCAPEEILLIDDSRANLMAAEKVGWHVLWFDYARPTESAINVREALAPAE